MVLEGAENSRDFTEDCYVIQQVGSSEAEGGWVGCE